MRVFFWILTLCFLFGCIDRIEIDTDGEAPTKIVINGGITNLPGPQEIRVFRSADAYDSEITSFPIRDARVFVEDDLGNVENFTLTSDDLQSSACIDLDRDLTGTQLDLQRNYRYQSSEGFSGLPGRTYTLTVELADGTVVRSDQQLLKPAISIEEIRHVYVSGTTLNESGNEMPADRWDIFVDLNGLDRESYLTWRYRGTFAIRTNPEQFCDFRDCSPPNICIPPCCEECWVIEYGERVQNFSPQASQQAAAGVLAAQIPIEDQKSTSVYFLQLFQYHIDGEVFNYFESIDRQLTNQGSIFDPTPYSATSNLQYADGREEPILGYFWAAGAIQKNVEISPNSIARQYDFFYPNDCQTIPGASTEKPDYYIF